MGTVECFITLYEICAALIVGIDRGRDPKFSYLNDVIWPFERTIRIFILMRSQVKTSRNGFMVFTLFRPNWSITLAFHGLQVRETLVIWGQLRLIEVPARVKCLVYEAPILKTSFSSIPKKIPWSIRSLWLFGKKFKANFALELLIISTPGGE